MGRIKTLTAREILDSSGTPTIEGWLELDTGVTVSAQIPAGASSGHYEGVELRDKDMTRYKGRGVLTAVSYINNGIALKLQGVDIAQSEDIDAWLLKADGTEKYEKLGVNTILVVSILLLKAAAAEARLPLYRYINELFNKRFEEEIKIVKVPTPIVNLMNGGMHGTNNLNFEEFHVIPSTSTPFPQALQVAAELHVTIHELFTQKNIIVPTSDEGGYIPALGFNTEALDVIQELAVAKKHKLGVDIFIGIDCAANGYYKDKRYTIRDRPSPLNIEKYYEFLKELVNKYNPLILEDPLSIDDSEYWEIMVKELGEQVYVLADDFIGGSKKRLEKAVNKVQCNALSIKLNQVATMTQMFSLIAMARNANMKIVTSHRMGETNDDFIADLAVGIQADFVKFGSPIRGERVAKYNRLLQIDSEITKV